MNFPPKKKNVGNSRAFDIAQYGFSIFNVVLVAILPEYNSIEDRHLQDIHSQSTATKAESKEKQNEQEKEDRLLKNKHQAHLIEA